MRLTDIPSNTAIFPNARAISYDGGKTAVLLLHGWTGWTGRLAYLAERLAGAGFTVRLPRLPGHGTNLQDFRASTWKDWLRRAMDEFLDLRDRSETVYVAGASMGALLTILIAAQFEVPRIVLMAPALQARNRLVFLAPLIQHIVPRIASDWDADNDPDPESSSIGAEYKSHTYTGTIAQLYRIQQRARRALPALRSQTLAIVSEKDEAVPPSVAKYITDRVPDGLAKVLMLENSGHQMVQGVDREAVCEAVLDWFSDRR